MKPKPLETDFTDCCFLRQSVKLLKTAKITTDFYIREFGIKDKVIPYLLIR